jgi:hypothetical protein
MFVSEVIAAQIVEAHWSCSDENSADSHLFKSYQE